jgi:hypothetical protein
LTIEKREAKIPANTDPLTNGSGAAAILSAGIGAFLLGLLSIVADKVASLKYLFVFYQPTGPLSGVTTMAIVAWLLAWAILEMRWRKRNVNLTRISAAAFLLLGLSLLLTFPPIAELF